MHIPAFSWAGIFLLVWDGIWAGMARGERDELGGISRWHEVRRIGWDMSWVG